MQRSVGINGSHLDICQNDNTEYYCSIFTYFIYCLIFTRLTGSNQNSLAFLFKFPFVRILFGEAWGGLQAHKYGCERHGDVTVRTDREYRACHVVGYARARRKSWWYSL